MASLDPSIILQARAPEIEQQDPFASYGKALQLKSLLSQQKVQDQAFADDQASREAFKSANGDQTQYIKNLAAAGNIKAYQAAVKAKADQDKAEADLGKTKAETAKTQGDVTNQAIARHRDQLAYVDSPQAAAQWVQAGYQDPVAGKVLSGLMPLDQAIARIPSDPVLFNQWKQQAALGATKYIEMNKPTYQTRNLGGSTDTIALPGLGGPAQVVSSMRNTVSPDAALSSATTRRGQDMVDARQKQALQMKNDSDNKPLPPSALKLVQEDLDAIGTSSSINADLGTVASQIKNGQLSLSPTQNLLNRGRNAVGMSNEQSRNFASLQSTLEKLRNDSLRLNKGVQTEGDAQRAWNELFANLNDTGVVQQRLGEIQRINERAINLRKNSIDTVRANYGKGPMDTSAFQSQPSALGNGGGVVDFGSLK